MLYTLSKQRVGISNLFNDNASRLTNLKSLYLGLRAGKNSRTKPAKCRVSLFVTKCEGGALCVKTF